MLDNQLKIAVIGLGYVGLPLAVEFGKKFNVVGFDINQLRVDELRRGVDHTLEVSSEELHEAKGLSYSAKEDDISEANFYIVTVPTPIDDSNQPDFTPLVKSSETIGKYLNDGDIVVYESTVYPGATEEVCVPILERISGLKFNHNFFVGYSPERINPGDKTRGVASILKITSGSTAEVANFVNQVYQKIITAGTYQANSIKVAEAAKVIENTQRDINIALINEVAILCNKLGIDTEEVLLAAGTKWNFLPFRPGLVGGHCIGVDPYYLTYKAQAIGYHPELILAGRRLNDQMGVYVASQMVKSLVKKRIHVDGARVLIMGLTFKENCPDLRNTKVIDIVRELAEYNIQVDVYEPWASSNEAEHEYQITLTPQPQANTYDGIILAVAHDQFKSMTEKEIRALGKPAHVLYDLKYILPKNASDVRL